MALKFVKFQDVQNIQFFVKDNQVCIKKVLTPHHMEILHFQTGEEVTEIEFLELFGHTVQTTNMKELKKKG